MSIIDEVHAMRALTAAMLEHERIFGTTDATAGLRVQLRTAERDLAAEREETSNLRSQLAVHAGRPQLRIVGE